MIVYILEDYNNKGHSFQAGQMVELDPAVADWLISDAPGCFSLMPPIIEKAPSKPAVDKMIGSPKASKSWDDLTVAELRDLLKAQGLPTSGNKRALLKRLENA